MEIRLGAAARRVLGEQSIYQLLLQMAALLNQGRTTKLTWRGRCKSLTSRETSHAAWRSGWRSAGGRAGGFVQTSHCHPISNSYLSFP